MKLKSEIIERINGRSDVKKDLLKELKITRSSLWRFLKDNISNGPLTTYKALLIISNALAITPEEALIDDPALKQEEEI
jgi:transcriptional regulator with XRE-family HTH domain